MKKNQDLASGSGVAGWARVPGRCGWKPSIKVCMPLHCLGIVTYSMLSVQSIHQTVGGDLQTLIPRK